eukprot:1290037-Alexandrium_andersonii.AAC.1
MLLYARARILAPTRVQTLIVPMLLNARADPGAEANADPHRPDAAPCARADAPSSVQTHIVLMLLYARARILAQRR